MRRLEIEPTQEAILKSIEEDAAGRNEDLAGFIKLLEETEGPFIYMIDAPWGDGKSFFVKSVVQILEMLNPQINPQSDIPNSLSSIVTSLGDGGTSFLPFYFNAWENDYFDDPLLALFGSMGAAFNRNDLLKEKCIKDSIASVLDAGLGLFQITPNATGVVESLSGKSLIEAYEKRAEIRNRIKEMADDGIKEVANKLVIFIDELDRCRPDFAVRLLEETKNLFASEDIILVFSTDLEQLAKAVGGAYGQGFDTFKYLHRFYDELIRLTPVDSFRFVNEGKNVFGNSRFDVLVGNIAKQRPVPIRETYKLNSKLMAAREYGSTGLYCDITHRIAADLILPLLVFIEHENIELLREITNGLNFDALYEYGSGFSVFVPLLQDEIAQYKRCRIEEIDRNTCKTYMHDICLFIFGNDKSEPEFIEALGHFHGDIYPEFDSRVYKLLKFDS